MATDLSGFEVTASNAEAAAALGRGIKGFTGWSIDAVAHLDEAMVKDPDCVMASAVKGLILVGGRSDNYKGVVDGLLAAAQRGAGNANPREKLYVKALEAGAAGRPFEAATVYEAILADHPTDLLAHRLIQQELFWTGESKWMQDTAERAAPAWNKEHSDYSGFLSVRSFSNEEGGDYEIAERCGREAVEIDPRDCWGTHAVAHVLVMQGRIDDGVDWLEPLTGNWEGSNQIVHHLWWHLALFLLERGDHARILDLLDTKIRNPDSPLVQAVPDAYIDLQNVAALLMRLELRGVDIGNRWSTIADICAERIGNNASPFTNAHAAMVLAATGRFAEADQLVAAMRTFVAGDTGTLGPATRIAAIPAAEASIAHRKGEHEAVLSALLPARRNLWQMGGSHAQRDVFWQLLVDSAVKLGRTDLAHQLLDEIAGIGFERVGQRTLYGSAAA